MLDDRDYVMRLAKQVAAFLARAFKLADEQKPDQALSELRDACGDVLGMEYEVLSMLDARSAVDLLGSKDRVLAFISLVEAMGEVDLRAGEVQRAKTRFVHALELATAVGDSPCAERLSARL